MITPLTVASIILGSVLGAYAYRLFSVSYIFLQVSFAVTSLTVGSRVVVEPIVNATAYLLPVESHPAFSLAVVVALMWAMFIGIVRLGWEFMASGDGNPLAPGQWWRWALDA